MTSSGTGSDLAGFEKIPQRLQLLPRWRIVNPVDQGRLAVFQALGRRHVGLDHHLFDELVRFQALGNIDACDPPLVVEADLALGQIEIERFTPVSRGSQRKISVPQGLQRRLHQRRGLLVRVAVERCLGLLVGELGRRPHQRPQKRVAALVAMLVIDHPNGETGAIFAFPE